MIKGFKSKVLKRYWTKADQSLIRPDQVTRVGLILTVLDNATKLDDVASIVSFAFHPLKGDQKGRYAVKVNANWRITFGWDQNGPDAIDLDLEDYH